MLERGAGGSSGDRRCDQGAKGNVSLFTIYESNSYLQSYKSPENMFRPRKDFQKSHTRKHKNPHKWLAMTRRRLYWDRRCPHRK